MILEELILSFTANAKKAGGELMSAVDYSELDNIIKALCEGADVYFDPRTEIEKKLTIEVTADKLDPAKTDVCVEQVAAAIAETGSLILSSMEGKDLRPGLLAPHHIAILQSSDIYATLEDYVESIDGHFPANFTLETGPSRTADIELTLTIGVHGPERVTILLV